MFYVSYDLGRSPCIFQEKRRNLRQVPPRRILRKRSHPFLGLLSDRHYTYNWFFLDRNNKKISFPNQMEESKKKIKIPEKNTNASQSLLSLDEFLSLPEKEELSFLNGNDFSYSKKIIYNNNEGKFISKGGYDQSKSSIPRIVSRSRSCTKIQYSLNTEKEKNNVKIKMAYFKGRESQLYKWIKYVPKDLLSGSSIMVNDKYLYVNNQSKWKKKIKNIDNYSKIKYQNFTYKRKQRKPKYQINLFADENTNTKCSQSSWNWKRIEGNKKNVNFQRTKVKNYKFSWIPN